MALERTFSMIKPDATRRNLTGAITQMLEAAGLRVIASRRVWMSRREAEGFYAVHKDRPFFGELVEFMWPSSDAFRAPPGSPTLSGTPITNRFLAFLSFASRHRCSTLTSTTSVACCVRSYST